VAARFVAKKWGKKKEEVGTGRMPLICCGSAFCCEEVGKEEVGTEEVGTGRMPLICCGSAFC
jgi:hypothetical protein